MSDQKNLLPVPSETNLMDYGKFNFTSNTYSSKLISVDPYDGSPSDYTVMVANRIVPTSIDATHYYGTQPVLLSSFSPCYLFEDGKKWSFILSDQTSGAQPETYLRSVTWAIVSNAAVPGPVLSVGPVIAVKGSYTSNLDANDEEDTFKAQTVTVSSALNLSLFTVFTSINGNYSAFLSSSTSNGTTWTMNFRNFRYQYDPSYTFSSAVEWCAVRTSLLV